MTFEWFEYTGRDATFSAPLPAGHFHNPILAGYYPDPSVTRVGDKFYLVNSTFAHWPGIPDPREHRPRALDARSVTRSTIRRR